MFSRALLLKFFHLNFHHICFYITKSESFVNEFVFTGVNMRVTEVM